jgi:hypothetical protein
MIRGRSVAVICLPLLAVSVACDDNGECNAMAYPDEIIVTLPESLASQADRLVACANDECVGAGTLNTLVPVKTVVTWTVSYAVMKRDKVVVKLELLGDGGFQSSATFSPSENDHLGCMTTRQLTLRFDEPSGELVTA